MGFQMLWKQKKRQTIQNLLVNLYASSIITYWNVDNQVELYTDHHWTGKETYYYQKQLENEECLNFGSSGISSHIQNQATDGKEYYCEYFP